MSRNPKIWFAGGVIAIVAPFFAHAQPSGSVPPGAKYVAMGSSFAAGPGVTTSADTPPTRCRRSVDNYSHQLARRYGLALTDVSCGGATTAHLLGSWNELPAQIDAVDAATRLVTITIGGNDVTYTRGLGTMACVTAVARGATPSAPCSAVPAAPTEKDFAALEANLRQIADEVRRRAPSAQLVFVDYPTVLPPSGTCDALSLTDAQAGVSREINRRVVEITRRVSLATASGLIAASNLSADHHACSPGAWSNGYKLVGEPDGIIFHPRLAAHTAIAQALGQLAFGR